MFSHPTYCKTLLKNANKNQLSTYNNGSFYWPKTRHEFNCGIVYLIISIFDGGIFCVWFFECVVVCKDMQGMNQYKSLFKEKLIL